MREKRRKSCFSFLRGGRVSSLYLRGCSLSLCVRGCSLSLYVRGCSLSLVPSVTNRGTLSGCGGCMSSISGGALYRSMSGGARCRSYPRLLIGAPFQGAEYVYLWCAEYVSMMSTICDYVYTPYAHLHSSTPQGYPLQ